MSKKWSDQFWLQMCDLYATQSHCVKKQTAAILVKDRRFVAAGVNGTLPGECNTCEDENGKSKHNEVIHAEINCIAEADNVSRVKGATMYLNYTPCFDCAKHLVRFGVVKLVMLVRTEDRKDKLLPVLKWLDNIIELKLYFDNDGKLEKLNIASLRSDDD